MFSVSVLNPFYIFERLKLSFDWCKQNVIKKNLIKKLKKVNRKCWHMKFCRNKYAVKQYYNVLIHKSFDILNICPPNQS